MEPIDGADSPFANALARARSRRRLTSIIRLIRAAARCAAITRRSVDIAAPKGPPGMGRFRDASERQAIAESGPGISLGSDKIAFDKLPRGVDLSFDGAVNSGPSQSVKWLQRALRMSVVDGILGEATLAAVGAHNAPEALINDICDIRLRFLRALKTWPTFGRGDGRIASPMCARLRQGWCAGGQYEPVAPTRRESERRSRTRSRAKQKASRCCDWRRHDDNCRWRARPGQRRVDTAC